MSPKQVLLAVLLAYSFGLPNLFAQQVQLLPPPLLNVCGTDQLQFIISSGGSELQNATLSLNLPCGFHYIPGSADGGSEANISIPGQPEFNLPFIAAGETLNFQIGVHIQCQALPCIDAGTLFSVSGVLNHSLGSQNFQSNIFNVETANLLITHVSPPYWEGSINQTLTRTITVRNTRPGRLQEFEFLDVHVSSVSISSNSGQTILSTPDTLLLRFGPQHFAQIGNGDEWFDFNEEITIVEHVQIIDCSIDTRSALSDLIVRWGCTGEFCQSQKVKAKVKIVDQAGGGNVLNFFQFSVGQPNCMDGGQANQSFGISRVNQGTDLLNFQVTLNHPGGGRGLLLGSVNNHPLIDTVIYHNLQLSACGDSVANSATVYFISPLPPPTSGAGTINLAWKTAFCEPGACSPAQSNWTYNFSYTKTCSEPGSAFVQGNGQQGSISPRFSGVLSLVSDFDVSSEANVVFALQNFNLSTTSGTLQLELSFPAFLVLQPTDFMLGGVLPSTVNIETNTYHTIQLSYELPLNQNQPTLTIPTILDCNALPNLPCITSLESDCESYCPVPIETPSPYPLTGDAVILQNNGCSEEGHIKTCTSISRSFPCYDGICYDTLPGYLDYTFIVERTTLGWPDKDGDLQPDDDGIFDYDLLRLDRIAPGDTFELRIDGVVRTDVPGTELEYFLLELGHEDFKVFYNFNATSVNPNPTFDVMIGENKGITDLSAQVEIFDASTATWYQVDTLSRNFISSNRAFIYDLSIPSLLQFNTNLPIHYRYVEGDSVRIRIQKRLSRNLRVSASGSISPTNSTPINETFFTFDYNTRLYLGDEFINPNLNYSTCNCASQKVEMCNFRFRLHGTGNSGVQNNNCTHAENSSEFVIINSNLGFEFPGEIRPFLRPEQIRISKTPGIILDSVRFRLLVQTEYILYPFEDDSSYYINLPDTFPFIGFFPPLFPPNPAPEYGRIWFFRHFEGCVELTTGNEGRHKIEVVLNRSPASELYISGLGEIDSVQVSKYGPFANAEDVLDLHIPSPIQSSFSANFVVDINLIVKKYSLNNSQTTLPYDNIFLRPIYPAAVFDSIQIVNTVTGEVYPQINGIFQLGTVINPDTLELQLQGISKSCGTETIYLEYGFDCSPHTDPGVKPCALTRDSVIISFPPGLIDVQASAQALSAALCDTMPQTQTLFFNAGLGAVYQNQIEITLPPGLYLLSGSCQIEYPAGSGQLLPIPDPTPVQSLSYSWKLADVWPLLAEQGLAGVNSFPANSFNLLFDTNTDCDFISGTRIIYRMKAEQACELPTNSVAKVSAPYRIDGVEPPYASNLNIGLSGSLNCADTLLVNASFTCPPNSEAGLYINLPPGIQYVPGSSQGGSNYTEPQQQEGLLRWNIQDASPNISFSFQLVVSAFADCTTPVLSCFTTANTPALCISDGQICDIEVVSGESNIPLSIDKAEYEVVSVQATGDLQTGLLSVQALIANTANPNSQALQAALYLDMDGDGQLSAADSLLQNITLNGISEVGGSQLLEAVLHDLDRANWCQLLLVLLAEPNCACFQIVEPLNSLETQQSTPIGLCWNDSADIGVPPLSNFSYQWSSDAGLDCTQCPQTGFHLPNTGYAPAFYSSILQEQQGACIINHRFDITVNPEPAILTNNEVICEGDTVQLFASPGTSFEWAGPNLLNNGQQLALAAPSASADYTLEITDNLGCSNTDSVWVEVAGAPSLLGESLQSFCFGPPAQIQLEAEPGVAYLWLNGQGQLSNSSVPASGILQQQDFVYQLQAQNSSCSRVFEVAVSFFQAFEISGLDEPVSACLGDTLQLSLSGGNQHQWSGSLPVFCTGTNCQNVQIPITNNDAVFNILALDEDACEASMSFSVQVFTDSIAPVEAMSLCQGDSLLVYGQWVQAAGLYCDTTSTVGSCIQVACLDLTLLPTWSDPQTASICEGESYDFYGTALSLPGTYSESLIASNGCDSLIVLDLVVLPTLTISQPASICQNDTLLFHGQILTQAGIYLANFQSTQGCDSTVVLELTVLPTYDEALQESICEGELYDFNGQLLEEEGLYEAALQTQTGCDSLVRLELTVLPATETFLDSVLCAGQLLQIGMQTFEEAGDYVLFFTDAYGCDSTLYLLLEYHPQPILAWEVWPDFGYEDGRADIALPDSSLLLFWENGSEELQRSNLQAGVYLISLQDHWGCLTQFELEVPWAEIELAMPNAFTPNSDGVNDFFNVVSSGGMPEVTTFQIFNRWGQQMYDNQSPEQGWDGRFKGEPQPQDVYAYLIEVRTPSGIWKQQGQLMLVR